MSKMKEGHDRWDNQRGAPPASSSPLSPHRRSSTQTRLSVESPPRPPWMNEIQTEQDEDSGRRGGGTQRSELPPSHFFEELFCAGQAAVPLAAALVASSAPQSDVVKRGYLGKLERNNRRYFALRAGSHTGPSRLEWYKSQERFTATEKSAGKAALFGSSKQGVIYLRCCLGVSRAGSSRKGRTVALYAKDRTMVLVAEDQQEQDAWYLAIKRLLEEERREEEHGERFEEDDGYCTLPPAPFFKEVWPVSVKSRGLGRTKSLTGETRLCLTASSLILIKIGACGHLPSVTIPLLSVRRFGHLDGSFFLELGRSAPDGPGEIWMEARDQGNPGIAQHIHEAVLDTVWSLRALPDFSRSPTSNHGQPQALLLSKRSRPTSRDKLVNATPLRSRPTLPPRNTDIQKSPTQSYLEPRKPDRTELESTPSVASHRSPLRSPQSSTPETCSYVEMKTNRCGVAARGLERLEVGDEEEDEEEEEEGLEYMVMSPQVSPSSPVSPQDEYVTIVRPRKLQWPPDSSPSSVLQAFDSSKSDNYSAVSPSHLETDERSRPHGQPETEASQSRGSDARQEQRSEQRRRHPAQTEAASSPVGIGDGRDPTPPFVPGGQGHTQSVQTHPNSGAGLSGRSQAVPDRSAVRRYQLLSCLACCLQDRS